MLHVLTHLKRCSAHAGEPRNARQVVGDDGQAQRVHGVVVGRSLGLRSALGSGKREVLEDNELLGALAPGIEWLLALAQQLGALSKQPPVRSLTWPLFPFAPLLAPDGACWAKHIS